ncbi:MAG: hypothetical protein IPI74_07960 [Bacteroidales bacterium]|nr:hypothetical protein [Bacteroidales bacterium]
MVSVASPRKICAGLILSTTGRIDESAVILRSIYNDYQQERTEIYQISLDPDAERWKNVVRHEEIPWISVRGA